MPDVTTPKRKPGKIVTRDVRWYGYRPDLADFRDHAFTFDRAAPVPENIDLRQHCPPVMNQGNLGSCTAHGITLALRFLLIKAGAPDAPLARLQLYYDERVVEGSVKEDGGAQIRDGIKCAAKKGVAHESLWPYKIGKFKSKPPAPAYKDALAFQALTYQRVAVSPAAFDAALATGFPIVIGFSVYDSFESQAVADTGVMPMPDKGEDNLGGHCVAVVGKTKDHYICQNSWDTDWGQSGFFLMPRAYVNDDYVSDCWRILTLG